MGYDAYAVSGIGVEIDCEDVEGLEEDDEFHGFVVATPNHEDSLRYLFWKDSHVSVGSGEHDGVELQSGEYDKIYAAMKEVLEPLGLWSHEAFGFWTFLRESY